MAAKDKCETKRVSVSLPLDTIKKLDAIASRHGITMTDAIRRAIATEDYIDSKIQEDSKILIQKADNTLVEVVFRWWDKKLKQYDAIFDKWIVMDTNKRKKVETAGWKIGDANNFLNLTEAETKLVEIKLRLALPTKKKKKKP